MISWLLKMLGRESPSACLGCLSNVAIDELSDQDQIIEME